MKKVVIDTPSAVPGTCADNGILFGGSAGFTRRLTNVTGLIGGASTLKSVSLSAVTSGASPAVDVFFFNKSVDLGDINSVPDATQAAAASAHCLGKIHFPSVDADESIFITDSSNAEKYVSVKNNVDLVVESEKDSQSIYYMGIARESVSVGAAGDFQMVFSFE